MHWSLYATIKTTPGEVLAFTTCDHYSLHDGVEFVNEHDPPPGCYIHEDIAEGDVYTEFCSEGWDSTTAEGWDVSWDTFEYGWERVYLRRTLE